MLIVAAFLGRGLPQALRSVAMHIQVWRGLSQLASVVLFFSALNHIGLAEATAIMDVNPVLITLFAALFLGERIGIRRALGIALAMAGALIIIRPGSGVLHPAAVLPLIGAVSYAAGAILTRMARGDSTSTSVLWSALIGTVATTLALPLYWQPIAAGDLWAFAAMGALGTIAQVLIIRAFAVAEASAIAPFGYSGLIWAGLWGWLFWGTIPDGWTLLGAGLIVGAGLYVWAREARLSRS
jgi:drug/metabolite transporter (DMT)-like permease